MIRLVAIDIDDTLLTPDRQVTPATRKAIASAVAGGTKVVLATGRMFCAAEPFARELELPGPLIAYQGALIKDLAAERIWRHLAIEGGILQELLHWLEERRLHINLYIDDELYVEEMNAFAERYARLNKIDVKTVGPLSVFRPSLATKVVVIEEPDLLAQLLPQAQVAFGSVLAVNRSLPHLLEFGHPEALKSRALAWLGEKWGITPQEMMAIGDGENDLDMLAFAGIGVAMANAPAVVRAAADHITSANTADGVALALARFLPIHNK